MSLLGESKAECGPIRSPKSCQAKNKNTKPKPDNKNKHKQKQKPTKDSERTDKTALKGLAAYVPMIFFPSCTSVALARSSHIVVLMNELYRCSCYVPHWGVKSGVRTITHSKVGSGPKENKSKQQQSKNHKKTRKTKTSQKQNRKESPDQTTPMGWQMMPLNYEILHGNKTQTTRSQSKIMRRCPAKQSTQQRRNPGSPLPGSRRSRREALQA